MDIPSLVLFAIFSGGFATGYGMRAFISARRRARIRARHTRV